VGERKARNPPINKNYAAQFAMLIAPYAGLK
jgi:hypothetical protein